MHRKNSWFYPVYLFIPEYKFTSSENSFWMRVLLLEWSLAGFKVEKRKAKEEEKKAEMDDIYCTPEYMCFCVLPVENSVCAAVLFLSRSSSVLPIGSANPLIYFLSF